MTNADSPLFSVVVPFHNNRAIVPDCFPTVAHLRKQDGVVGEIIAVDDCSTDGTAAWIRENHPDVTVLTNAQNLGFGRSCYNGIRHARCDWILLFNSDVKIVSDIVPPLVEDIEKHMELFSIGFFSFNEKGEKFEGRKKIVPKTGLFKTRNNFSGEYIDGVLYDTVYACGGHCLLSREKFLSLNGFSSVMEPFYWEDADLSYRALKRGWGVYFDPRCRVVHCHRGSIRTANSERAIKVVQTRNKMLFFWKNVNDPLLWLRHIAGMTLRLISSWLSGDIVFYRAFAQAIGKLSAMKRERAVDRKEWRRKDRELFGVGKTAI